MAKQQQQEQEEQKEKNNQKKQQKNNNTTQKQNQKKQQKNDNKKQQTLSSLEFKYKNGDRFYFYRFYDDMLLYIKEVDSLNDDEGFRFIECIRVDNKPHTIFQSYNSKDPALYNRIMYNESKNDLHLISKTQITRI